MDTIETKFSIGDVVKHKFLDFRGVIFDLDPEFNNTEEWYQSIPKPFRPSKDQPFYHLLAENGEIFYTAYVSQQNLEHDLSTDSLKTYQQIWVIIQCQAEVTSFLSIRKNLLLKEQ